MSKFHLFEAKMRAAHVPGLAIRAFQRHYERLVAGESCLLPESQIRPVQDVPALEEVARRAPPVADALARAVVIKLNGGLGTSMGMTRAKSLLEVKAGLSFLDIIARQVLHLRERHGVSIPLILMNSFRTREDSLASLSAYPDLPVQGLPLDFLQHQVPKVDAATLEPVRWPADPELEWCPPGHGDLYAALTTSGLLHALLERGYRYAFVSNADNLGAVVDPELLAWFAAEQIPFLMEVTARTESMRKGGHLARLADGRLVLRELAMCPPGDMDAFQDVQRHACFNTNNLWLNLEALERRLAQQDGLLDLPTIRNNKPVDPTDPHSTPVVQLESAMGAALECFEGARALQVRRCRYAPVKTTDDLLAVRSDAYVLDEEYRVVPAPGRESSGPIIYLDRAHYRTVDQLEERFPNGVPSLLRCDRLVVEGDVTFGRGVRVEGDVQVRQDDHVPMNIPAGALLQGSTDRAAPAPE